jgi:hypothetical protein
MLDGSAEHTASEVRPFQHQAEASRMRASQRAASRRVGTEHKKISPRRCDIGHTVCHGTHETVVRRFHTFYLTRPDSTSRRRPRPRRRPRRSHPESQVPHRDVGSALATRHGSTPRRCGGPTSRCLGGRKGPCMACSVRMEPPWRLPCASHVAPPVRHVALRALPLQRAAAAR